MLGKKWGELAVDRTVSLSMSSSSVSTCAQLLERLCFRLNVAKVEQIGEEGIVAGKNRVAGGVRCFLHATLDGGRIEIAVKSDCALLADKVCEACTQALC